MFCYRQRRSRQTSTKTRLRASSDWEENRQIRRVLACYRFEIWTRDFTNSKHVTTTSNTTITLKKSCTIFLCRIHKQPVCSHGLSAQCHYIAVALSQYERTAFLSQLMYARNSWSTLDFNSSHTESCSDESGPERTWPHLTGCLQQRALASHHSGLAKPNQRNESLWQTRIGITTWDAPPPLSLSLSLSLSHAHI